MRTVSHYEVLEKLGEGGMGVVWKARDTRLDRFVAIKFLPLEKTADPERRRRFAQEARAASALNHPRIITIYDIDHADGADFIVMEFVPGKTLEQLIPAKGMKTGDAVRYAMQIAYALAAAHAAGIVHRDLKPANVIVSDTGQLKVLDFGLAKLREESASEAGDDTRTLVQAARTEEGTIVGTTCYMSPEQAEGRKVDARSDIFSFGFVLYEMLTGKRAFSGDSKMSTLAAILRSEPEPLHKQGNGAPQELIRIVQRCLRKDPENRAQSMADLRIALKEIKEESESGLLVSQAPIREKSRRRLWLAAGLGVLTVAAGAAYLLVPGKRAPEAPLSAAVLTSYPGVETVPTFSPDGNQIAFVWNGEQQNNYDIYVTLLGTGRPLRLTSDPEADFSPAWSPDGRSIAFLRKNSILLIPPIGGTEREVGQGLFLTPTGSQSATQRGLVTWSPDGHWLLVSSRTTPNGPFALFLISPENGERRNLSNPPGGCYGDFGAIPPDGKTLVFSRIGVLGTPNMSDADIYMLPLGNGYLPKGELNRLTTSHSLTAGLAWTADSREIIYSAYNASTLSLWRLPVAGAHQPVKLTVGENGRMPAISRQGNRMVFEQSVPPDLNIWRIDLTDPGHPASPFIASTRIDQSPRYSLDGRRIAFASERSGPSAIWVSDADGGNAMQLTNLSASGSPSWSPDCKSIAFDSVVDGRWQVFAVPAAGGKAQQLTSGQSSHTRPTWSHDGQWIYSTGPGGIQKISSAGGTPVQLTKGGGTNALESVDRKTVYYQKATSLWRVGTDGSGDQIVFEGTLQLGFAPTSDGIYYISGPISATEVRFYNFATGNSSLIRKMTKLMNLGLTISPDRKWLVYTQHDTDATGDLMLVDAFR